MNKVIYRYLALIILSVFCAGFSADAQQDEPQKISPYLLFTYLKNTDSQRILQVRMTNITQTGEIPLEGLSIRFLNGDTVLGEAVTGKTGDAEYILKEDYTPYVGEDGSWPFAAEFDGDSQVDVAEGELSITDVNLEMILTEEEGKRNVTLIASFPSAEGPVPVADEEISVYVPRMFSLLPVGTGTLDAEGRVQIPFPDDIPGDKDGNLIVTGRFNDHYFFGNVEKRELIHWGTPMEEAPAAYRSLWSTLAPRWMIITLSILLLGVWGHYTYVIISLFRIRKDGRKNAKG
ncbi:MAG: hypothetical protein E4G92_00985 [Bacteroidia bacterium]|nr:MAG: hypothetical protein E4G92_00985 [Bacteroidia bacterium]